MTNQTTKERIEKIISDLRDGRKYKYVFKDKPYPSSGVEFMYAYNKQFGELADALIQAGVVFKDEVGMDEGKLGELINNSKNCPYCENIGYVVVGSCDDPEQQQCQWCDEMVDSKYNLAKNISSHTKDLLTFK